MNAAIITNFENIVVDSVENEWDNYHVYDASDNDRWQRVKQENKRDALSEVRSILGEVSDWQWLRLDKTQESVVLDAFNSNRMDYAHHISVGVRIKD